MPYVLLLAFLLSQPPDWPGMPSLPLAPFQPPVSHALKAWVESQPLLEVIPRVPAPEPCCLTSDPLLCVTSALLSSLRLPGCWCGPNGTMRLQGLVTVCVCDISFTHEALLGRLEWVLSGVCV